MTAPAEQQPISPLVADLITASLKQSQWTANTLIDNLTEDLAKAQAEIAAMRAVVSELLDGPYQPTSAAIERALYPSAAMIDRFRDRSQS